MPYEMRDNCVYKVGEDEPIKCHDTPEQAQAHMAALMANVEDAKEFSVYKRADGRYRWLITSSSSFQDRDKEIISQAALEADSARMNETGQFGTLDWWHTPIRLGACDFSTMHGRLSIESGTFDDGYIAEKLAEQSNELAASRSFRHSVTEPSADGVYSKIETFARALLPRGKESNLLTTVMIHSEEKEMLQDKIKELIAKLGGDTAAEAKVGELLAQAEKSEQAALVAGIAHKEETPPAEQKPPEAKPEEKPEEKSWFLADMKPEEFGALIGTAMKQSQEEMLGQMKKMMDEMSGIVNAMMEKSTKESGASLEKGLSTIAEKQASLDARLGMLEGLTPRAFRASQDPSTVTSKQVAPKDDERAAYFGQFINNALSNAPAKP